MKATPMICPQCGELVVAWPDWFKTTLVVPVHPDRVMPFEDCAAAARPTKSGRTITSR
jgi:hypothetical protein